MNLNRRWIGKKLMDQNCSFPFVLLSHLFFRSAGFVTSDFWHANPLLCSSWTSCTDCIWSQVAVFHEDEVVNEILDIKFWIKMCHFVPQILQSFFLYSSRTLKEVIHLMTALQTHCCIKFLMKDGRRTLSHLKMKYREFVLFILFWGAEGST